MALNGYYCSECGKRVWDTELPPDWHQYDLEGETLLTCKTCSEILKK